MHHDEDCPMPLENRGAPTVLNAPVTPPPEVVPTQDDQPIEDLYLAPAARPCLPAAAERVRARDPPQQPL